MTEDKMKGLFGGGEAGAGGGDAPSAMTSREMEREQRRAQRRAARKRNAEETAQAQDFINRYETGSPSEGFSSDEAVTYLRQLRDEASPEEWRRAAAATMNNLPEDQRKQFNEMLERRRAGTGMVTIERTGDARPTEGRPQGQAGDMGVDDVLGGLFGGLMGGAAAPQSGGNMPQPDTQGQNPLGDLFGGLFGGDDDKAPQPQQTAQQQPQGGVEDIFQNPLGKAVLGGLAAFALKELIDKQNQQ
jgi:hypothetical protein